MGVLVVKTVGQVGGGYCSAVTIKVICDRARCGFGVLVLK